MRNRQLLVVVAVITIAVLLVPLVGWARLNMKLHTWQQITCGAVLAAGIAVVSFASFGMVGG